MQSFGLFTSVQLSLIQNTDLLCLNVLITWMLENVISKGKVIAEKNNNKS